MNDDDSVVAIDVSDFEEDRSRVRADDHREPIAEVPDSNRVAESVKDLLLTQVMLQC